MDIQTKLEIDFLNQELSENNHYSNLFNNMRFRGWYRFKLEEGFNNHIFCIFRLPPAMPLYDNVLRKFTEEERKAGIHRFLVGKDLVNEVQGLLSKYNGDFSKSVASLDESEVNDLLGRLRNIITFDCNRIPYLHVKELKDDPTNRIDLDEEVKKHILSLPNYLDILYKTINEKIDLDTSDKLSNGIIYNEYTQHLNQIKGN